MTNFLESDALLAVIREDTAAAEASLREMLPGELDNLAAAARELAEMARSMRRIKLREQAQAENTPCDRGYPLGGANPRTDWCTVRPLHHKGMHHGEHGPFTDGGTVRREPAEA